MSPAGRRADNADFIFRLASATLLRPFQIKKQASKDNPPGPEKTAYEQQVELKQRFKTMLENEQLIPRVRPSP